MVALRSAILASSIGLLCFGVLPKAEAGASGPESDFESIRLVATGYNAGKIGKAFLVPQGEKTRVHVEVSGVPSYTSRPIHLYVYVYDGTCGSRNLKARYAATDHALAQSMIHPQAIGAFRGPARLSASIPVSFQTLRATQYAITVRTSPADGGLEIFCGDNSH